MSRAILANIFLVSHILLLFQKVAKYEKLGKYFSYCARYRAIKLRMSYSKKLFKDKDNSHVTQNDETRVTEDGQTPLDDQQITNILIRIENFCWYQFKKH